VTESPWPIGDEPLILAFLAGEVSEADPTLCELFARCPNLRDELRQLTSFAGAVDRAGRREREAWTATGGAAAVAPEPDSDQSVAVPRRPWRRVLVAGAALLAAGLVIGVYFATRDATRPERVLGVHEERVLHPLRAADGFAKFAWSAAPVPRAQVRVHFDDGREPFVHDVEGSSWQPSASELPRLAGAVRWEVWIERPGQLELWARATL
jgi:hypothetical protein